jgi:3-dehydroquinate synthase
MKSERLEAETRSEEFPSERYEMTFSVPFDFPVYFTKDLFHPQNDLLMSVIDRRREHRRHRVKVFLDSGVYQAIPDLRGRIEAYFNQREERLELEGTVDIVPGGAQGKKGWELAMRAMEAIAEEYLCRQSFVVAVGGGSFLDIIGLAASLVHRGLRLIRVPTTVLSQNDAGVGVKNGIDHRGMKNFAGTFAPPFAVLIDYRFLETLPGKYWTGGIAEAFKVAIIKDPEFFDFLCRNSGKLRQKDATVISTLVKRCAVLHLDHIRNNGDPFEFGSARPLDFGHWSAHKLEVLSGYGIGHGQAVSIGIAMDTYYAAGIGLITENERDTIIDALEKTGLPVWSDFLEKKTIEGGLEILEGLREFQEHLGGELNITLPDGIGQKVEIHEMDHKIIKAAICYLKRRASQGAGASSSGI